MNFGNSYRAMRPVVLALMTVLTLAAGSTAEPYVLGELVLKMQPGHTLEEINTIFGTIEAQHLAQTDVYLVNIGQSTNLDSVSALIESTNAVEFCHPNYIIDPLQPVQSSLPVSDDLGSGSFAEQAAATRLSLDITHEFSTGANVRVAVLDGGIDYTHPALQNFAVNGYDYVDDDVDAMDEPGGPNGGHGTFVSGVVHLVAPNAQIRAYRVTDINGESNGYLVAEAILQAIDDGCQVVNLSMVTTGVHEAIAGAIAYAAEHEVLVVVAAGNGHDGGTAYPASDPNAYCVAALDTTDQLADFSNYGDYIDVCAPGVEIYSSYLNHGYAWWGGTSFAAPFVAAQAALLLEYDSTATRQSVIDAINATAEDIYDANGEYVGQLGAGLIDPLASLIALRGGASVLPVPELYPTIQAAIDAAEIGDTILVGPGVYHESINFNQKVLYLFSSAGPEETILKPAGPGQPIITMDWVQFGYPGVRGFTFTGVTGADVIHLFYSSPRIRNCVFRDNNTTSANGWCVWAETASTTVDHCIFYNNGGEGCIRPMLQDVWPIVYVTNNTFHRNGPPLLITGNAWGDGLLRVTVAGNIFSENTGTGITSSLPLYRVQYNLFWENETNFSPTVADSIFDTLMADPQFISPSGAELYLLPGSPAVDAGDPDPMLNDPDGTRNDIGALPLKPAHPVAIGLTVEGKSDYASIFTSAPTFAWIFHDSGNAAQTAYQIQVGTDDDWAVAEMWEDGPQTSTASSVLYGGAPLPDLSQYFVRVRVSDGVDWSPWNSAGFQTSIATVIHVPADFGGIQEAMAFASEGDTVLVAPGTYTGNIVMPGNDLLLLSESGRDSTVLQPADSTAPTLVLDADLSALGAVEGFTFRWRGFTARTNASFRLRDCRFETRAGRAIFADLFGEGEIVGNEIVNSNQGIYLDEGVVRIDSNTIINCDAQIGMQVSDCHALIRYNVIIGSCSWYGIWSLACRNLVVENNTVAYNSGTGMRLDQYHSAADTTVLYNNLSVFNGIYGIQLYNNVHPDEIWSCDYNNVYANNARNWYFMNAIPNPADTLSADPLFIDPANGDFSFPLGSPCVDAGNPDPSYNDPDGTRNDIGAIWSPQTAVYPLATHHQYLPSDGDGYVTDLVPTINWTYEDQTPSTQAMYEIEVGTDQDWSAAELWASGPVSSSATSVSYSGPPLTDFHQYFVRVRVNNGTTWGSWFTATFRLHTTGTIRVPEHFASIQEAIDAALDYDTILVSAGIYEEALLVDQKSVSLISEDGAAVTTLQLPTGEVGVVVTFNEAGDSATALEGFTIRAGTNNVKIADSAPQIRNNLILDAAGIGVYVDDINADLIIRDNVIAGNEWGLNVNTYSRTVYIENNVIRDNVRRGGMRFVSSRGTVVLERNLFLRNASPNNLVYAGGLYLQSGKHTVRNNTFYQNGDVGTDHHGGVRIGTSSGTDFRNNIIAFSHGTGLRIDDTTNVTLGYNDVYGSSHIDYLGGGGLVPGEGAISVDPLFVDPLTDDYALQSGSPCIDAGDTAVAFVEVDWTRIDMGAISTAVSGGMPIVTQIGVQSGDLTHLLDSLPVISWSYEDTLGGQTAFELQVGTNFTWDDPEDWLTGVVTSSATTVQYSGLPMERGVDYFVRLRLYNGVTWGGWNGIKLHRNSTVVAPAMAGPMSDRAPLITTLDVSCPSDPEGDSLFFDYELYADSLYDSLIVSFVNVPSKKSPPAGVLVPETDYYWRARAYDGYEYSTWSPLFMFRTIAEAGLVRLEEPLEPTVACGQPIKFEIGAVNDQPNKVAAMFNAFRVWSPDGAAFDSVIGEWINETVDWSVTFDLINHVSTRHGSSADTVGFSGLSIWGTGLAANTEARAFRLTTEVSCTDRGKSICVDQSWTPDYYSWMWDLQINHSTNLVSPVWDGMHCFTIEQCCVGERGDVNSDGVNANLSDLTYLVNYLFLGGPAPSCLAEANINGDPAGRINLTDVTVLVNHAFITFAPLPSCGEFFVTAPAKQSGNEQVRLTCNMERDTTIIYVESSVDLLGVQLTLTGSGSGASELSLEKPFSLFQSISDGLMTAGIFDATTGAAIPAGGRELLRIPGRWDVQTALAVDRTFREHTPEVGLTNTLIPREFELSQNYPNPFNPNTVIRFGLPVSSNVKLEVLNILGQRVTILADRRFDAGYHDIEWQGTTADGQLVASGVYFYRLRTDSFTASKKMILLK